MRGNTLGISPRLVKEIFKTIRTINENTHTTIALVEQNANIALRIGHFGYVMEGGQIKMGGTTQELICDDRVKSAYLGKKNGRDHGILADMQPESGKGFGK